MFSSAQRQRIVESPVAALAVLPDRLAAGASHLRGEVKAVSRWLMRSREHTNYTYDLTELNRCYLGSFVASIADCSDAEAARYLTELHDDFGLAASVRMASERSRRHRIADHEIRWARRAGWYALVRLHRPHLVVETGTDKGLGSRALAAALARNERGRLITIDTNSTAGSLITDEAARWTEQVTADSVEYLATLAEPVDMFIHDSLHSYEHELAEFEAVAPKLSNGALVLSDNAHVTGALRDWAVRTGRTFHFFREQPADHWYRGAGIGVAKPPRDGTVSPD